MKEIREIRVWRGEYREIPFEINTFELFEHKMQWTFYLFIREPQFNKEIFDKFWLKPREKDAKDRVWYDYYDEPLINDIDWHGGCTWYQKLDGFDGALRSVQIGCDYGHSFDERHLYDFKDVLHDTERAIDSLHELIPDIKHWCYWCGTWGIEGYLQRNHGYICRECLQKHPSELLGAKND